MKRLSAMILSLLLLWAQVFVLALPAGAAQPTACRCCDCQQTDCCVSESPSTSPPLAAAPVPSVQLNLNLFAHPASLAWVLPGSEVEIAATSLSPLLAVDVPLFTQHCARLI